MGTSPSKETRSTVNLKTNESSTIANAVNSNMKKPPTKKGVRRDKSGYNGSGPNRGVSPRSNADEKEGNDGGTASTAASGISAGMGMMDTTSYLNNGISNPKQVRSVNSTTSHSRMSNRSPSGQMRPVNCSVIQDETVKVNLAMADLMAYL